VEEIKRIEDIDFTGSTYKTNCVKCGREIELYFNGGELDVAWCCGYEYELEHTQIDFVIRKRDSDV